MQANRTYKYTVSSGGKVVQGMWNVQIVCMWTSYDSKESWFCYSEDTVPGSGSASFPVSNGRGQVNLKLEPGDYTVTVQDLDAGVNAFYSESKDFSVAACELEISTFAGITIIMPFK